MDDADADTNAAVLLSKFMSMDDADADARAGQIRVDALYWRRPQCRALRRRVY